MNFCAILAHLLHTAPRHFKAPLDIVYAQGVAFLVLRASWPDDDEATRAPLSDVRPISGDPYGLKPLTRVSLGSVSI